MTRGLDRGLADLERGCELGAWLDDPSRAENVEDERLRYRPIGPTTGVAGTANPHREQLCLVSGRGRDRPSRRR